MSNAAMTRMPVATAMRKSRIVPNVLSGFISYRFSKNSNKALENVVHELRNFLL